MREGGVGRERRTIRQLVSQWLRTVSSQSYCLHAQDWLTVFSHCGSCCVGVGSRDVDSSNEACLRPASKWGQLRREATHPVRGVATVVLPTSQRLGWLLLWSC